MKKKVFICSPLRGEFEKNIEKAKRYSRFAVLIDCLPITPHIYFTHFLDDKHDKERETGILLGMELLKDCEELWTFGQEISKGMEPELKLAQSLNIPILDKSNEFTNWEKEHFST